MTRLRAATLLAAACLASPGAAADDCTPAVVPTDSRLRIGQEVACDLDGDGSPERIRLEGRAGAYGPFDEYTLHVGERSFTGHGAAVDSTFAIVDIDSADGRSEIAITEQGPSDDYETQFFALDADTILDMGWLPGSYEMTIDGSGLVRTSARGSILQTWFHPAYWRLDEAHRLIEIPLPLYAMNTHVAVIRSLDLQRSPRDARIALRLEAGTRATILASDDREWCLVRAASGATGWFAVENFDGIRGTGQRAHEFFRGLSSAD